VGALSAQTQHILLAGGGHAHAVALRLLSERPPKTPLRLTVVAPDTQNLYSGALPGVIAGHWPVDAIGVPLQPLCKAAGARFMQDAVMTLDADKRIARLTSGEDIAFDTLSLDIGSGVRQLGIPDPDEIAVPIRPIKTFLSRWQDAIRQMEAGAAPPTVVIIGAGLAGIEVCLAIRHRLQTALTKPARVYLVDASEKIAAANHPALRRKLAKALSRASVQVLTGTRLTACENGAAELSSGDRIPVALVVNCAGSALHPWVSETGLKTESGRVEVDSCLRSTSHPHVWAAGDTSYFTPHPLEPAGVFAVRAGPVIAENIRRLASGEPLTEFHPQSDYLKLVSLGDKRAVAEKYGLTVTGGWIWRLKKSIDFSFLSAHRLSTGD
jgi:pyridine nucleotide-disulfide oxidoreductase family protein